MTKILIELTALTSILIFSAIIYYFLLPTMKKEMKNYNWETYFKQCGIYQGTSHWTTLKNLILTIKK